MHAFGHMLFFNQPFKKIKNSVRVSNSLNPVEDRFFVVSDLGSNYMKKFRSGLKLFEKVFDSVKYTRYLTITSDFNGHTGHTGNRTPSWASTQRKQYLC